MIFTTSIIITRNYNLRYREYFTTRYDMNIKEIKELAKKFTPEQLEQCINQTLEHGKPQTEGCNPSGDILEVLNTLAKAQTIRELMDQGMSETEAIRELARRIREIQPL
jgi:hypothetical protein